jgi:hypothetical protein
MGDQSACTDFVGVLVFSRLRLRSAAGNGVAKPQAAEPVARRQYF